MERTKRIVIFNFCHVTQEHLPTEFVAKIGYFRIKPVTLKASVGQGRPWVKHPNCMLDWSIGDYSLLKAPKTRANCQSFSSLHRTKQKLARCACLKSQILIYQRAGTVGVNAINASN